MSRLQVFGCKKSDVREWLRSLDDVDEDSVTREQFENRDSCQRALRRVSQPWQPEDADAVMTTDVVRQRLLALVAGVPSDINNVPVKRLPCSGTWFDVASCWEPHDIHWQRLQLADAISRVKSGYYPRLADPPGMNAYYADLRETARVEHNAACEALEVSP